MVWRIAWRAGVLCIWCTYAMCFQPSSQPVSRLPGLSPPPLSPVSWAASLTATELLLPSRWDAFNRKHACLLPRNQSVTGRVPYVRDRRLSELIRDVTDSGAKPAIVTVMGSGTPESMIRHCLPAASQRQT